MSDSELKNLTNVSNRITEETCEYTRNEFREIILLVGIAAFFIGLAFGYVWAYAAYSQPKPNHVERGY